MRATQQRSILHVDLDAFFVTVEQLQEPQLAGKPVIVGGNRNQRGVVATASYEARRYGVRSGMALAIAERLCPQAIFVPPNFRLYQEASEGFFAILSRYTPLVETASLDEAYLDLTGCEAISGKAREAAEAIQRQVREELGLGCSVGVATSKVVAKVATEVAKPGGVQVVPGGGEVAFLAPRPMRLLPMVGTKMEAALATFGVRTIGDIASLPQAWLAERFGTAGSLLWLRANGIDTTPVHGERSPAKSIGRETTFPSDVSDVAFLRATLRLQAERVGAELRRNGQSARTVNLKLRYGDFSTILRSASVSLATNADRVIFNTACSLLDEAIARDERAIRLIGLRATGLSATKQMSLWETSQVADERLCAWLDKIRGKYGTRYLQTGRTFFQPEFAEVRVRQANLR